jgi:AcrR family transcriptional regulator
LATGTAAPAANDAALAFGKYLLGPEPLNRLWRRACTAKVTVAIGLRKSRRIYSERSAMTFGKPGRPPEDRLARQAEICSAVGPLILERGVGRLSMREAAYAACLSVGGLYHYFPTKRDLALHPLQPEALLRLCRDFHAAHGHLAEHDPAAYLDAYLDMLARTAGFLRPAVWAALELGVAELQEGLALGFSMPVIYEEFLGLLGRAVPDAEARDIPALANAVRRSVIGALLEKGTGEAALRAELAALLAGHGAQTEPGPARSAA